MYYPYYYDWTMLLLIPGMILAMYAQYKINSVYSKYSQVASSRRITGAEAAAILLRSNGVTGVSIQMVQGKLSDHFDPKKKVLALSSDVYQGFSLASLAVAAHETGHALQHHEGYKPLAIRSAIVPVAQFGSTLAIPLCFIGMFVSMYLVHIGIALFAGVVLFQLITLPVEFNASNRAIAMLEREGFVQQNEVSGTQAVLNAAALTYVAALITGILQLLRLWLIYGNRNQRRNR